MREESSPAKESIRPRISRSMSIAMRGKVGSEIDTVNMQDGVAGGFWSWLRARFLARRLRDPDCRLLDCFQARVNRSGHLPAMPAADAIKIAVLQDALGYDPWTRPRGHDLCGSTAAADPVRSAAI